jgi:N-acetylglucosamine-6-phosphate deacetylase
MGKYINIVNGRVIGFDNLQRIIINPQGRIENIIPMTKDYNLTINNQVLDFNGDWLSLGGIDLQINGALGLAFTDLESQDIPKLKEICVFLWQQGIDSFLPTIVTTSLKKIRRSLNTISQFMEETRDKEEAEIIGVHLEGPFLNYEKRGAHPAEYLLPLTVENVKQVLGKNSKIVKIITLAPELDSRGEVIKYLKSLGITISLGHSLATAEEAEKAFKNGSSMVTHAFNAMPSLHHRQPGLLGEAIINKNVYCGIIADGIHVNPKLLKILLKASDYEQGIFLVSDALAPMGLPDGIYPWDEREIEVKNGTARLQNGTLSGTTLPLLVGVENLVKWGICDVETAIKIATESPRKALGIANIQQGIKANLLRWHWQEKESKLNWQRLKINY